MEMRFQPELVEVTNKGCGTDDLDGQEEFGKLQNEESY